MGYSCYINSDREVSGSCTVSGSIAESFINHFVGELKKTGHEITYEMS